jgi:hypothetical protein
MATSVAKEASRARPALLIVDDDSLITSSLAFAASAGEPAGTAPRLTAPASAVSTTS